MKRLNLLYALYRKHKGDKLFIVEQSQTVRQIRYKMINKFHHSCVYFTNKSDAKDYLRHNGLPHHTFGIKKVSIPSRDKFNELAKDSFYTNGFFLVTTVDEKKAYLHCDSDDKEFKLAHEQDGAYLCSYKRAVFLEDELKFSIGDRKHGLVKERLKPIKTVSKSKEELDGEARKHLDKMLAE